MSRKKKNTKKAIKKKCYPSDLSRSQWKEIRRFFCDKNKIGRPNKYPLKEVLNGILYLLRTGCQWRQLPLEFPPWQSVFYHFSRWQKEGKIQQMHDFLRDKTRKLQDKEKSPSLGAIDSQSIKSSEQTAQIGYDAGKKVKGVKAHIVVDRLGLLLNLCVLPASIQDRDGARVVLEGLKEKYPRLEKVNADCAYAGQLELWVKEDQGFELEIIRKKEKGFKLLPERFFVERTFSWLTKNRRLSKCYERLSSSMENYVLLAMSKLLLNRLDNARNVA